MKSIFSSFVLCFFISFSFAQPAATTAAELQNALEQTETLTQNSLVKNLHFTNIGPTIMSGRVVDLDVNPVDPTEFYVAYASGGLWYTNNNGTSFTPVMDDSPTQNLGDIAVDWKNGTIWAGTGENNSSRSSYAGIGILKSTDKGKTWENMGLEDSHHFGRIIINPNNPDEVVVAVAGHLYSSNEMRGVYKTFDGGKTWNKTLFINNETGVIDLEADPNNFDVMYATSWQRDRKAWHFQGSGEGSAIFKSMDAGNTWTKISVEGSGFPTGEGVGRIGVAVHDANTVYAFLDNQDFRPEGKDSQAEGILTKDDFKSMTDAQFMALDNSTLNRFLRENNFQEKYRAENVKHEALAAIANLEAAKPVDVSTMNPALMPLFAPQVQGFLMDFMSKDPAALAKSVNLPMLIVHGDQDLQVTQIDAEALHKAQPKSQLRVIAGMNHALKTVAAGDRAANMAAYADPSLPLAPEVADTVAEFVKSKRSSPR